MFTLFHFLLLWSTMQTALDVDAFSGAGPPWVVSPLIFGAGWNPLASRVIAPVVDTVG